MARMIAERPTFTARRPAARRATPKQQVAMSPATPQIVLGDRIAGARPRTQIARRSNRALGKEMLTVLSASFIVSLLCLYVSAYARVTAEGFELSRLTRKIQAAQAREQALQATIAQYTSLETVAKRAEQMGMVAGQTNSMNLLKPGTDKGTADTPITGAVETKNNPESEPPR